MNAVLQSDHPVLLTALEAADAGLAVVWQQGKRAIATGWNKGPALTADELQNTFRPGLNCAFRAGPTSRLRGWPVAVVDVDIRSTDDADREEARAAYKALVGDLRPTVQTGGGGVHLYLRFPPDRLPSAPATVLRQSEKQLPSEDVNKPGKPAWTIELLSGEHAVTMPPSVHPSGKSYQWKAALDEVQDAPESLLALLPEPPLQPDAGRSASEPLPDPLPPVPTFNMALLPDALRDWCDDLAGGLQVPVDFVAVPALVAMAGALGGRRLAVKMKARANWYERPVLWGCVIGRPSSGKSPALTPARRMLERLNDEERKAWENEQAQHAAMQMVAEGRRVTAKENIRKALKQGDKSKAMALAEAAQVKVEDAPPEPRIVVNDATVEKLGELLNANPRGLVQFRDELAGWLASLDREGRESDRAFWLECWNGVGHYTVDRIGRGTIRIEACAVSMLGGMQPGKLAEYVRGAIRGGFADDGLMQRFQLAVFPDLPGTWRYTDKQPDPVAEAKAWAAFKRLRTLDPSRIGAELSNVCDVPFLRLDDEAQGLFVEWYTDLMQRLRAGSEPAFMESHLAKYPALAGRLALVLHLADNGSGPVSGDAMARALGWCEYLEGHARRIYAPGTDNGLTAAHALLRKRADLPDGFTARDVYRRCWSGLDDPDTVAEALGVLVEYGHLHESAEQTGGRPMTAYRWAS